MINRSRDGGIVAILPRGETIRNFVHTGTLDTIKAESLLTVLSVVPDTATFDSLISRYEQVIPLREIRERYPVLILREILEMAHDRCFWFAATHERWRYRDEAQKTRAQKVKRWGKKQLAQAFAGKARIQFLERFERAVSRVLRNTEVFADLYRELQPRLVFNGSHVHSQIAIQAVQAAQWLGIPTVSFIFSWDNLTAWSRVIPQYDYYLVWNDSLKGRLLDTYPKIRPERVLVTGTPQFDFHFHRETYWTRAEFCKNVGADPDRPIVLYTTGMAEHMPGEERIVEGIADMVANMKELGPPQLLCRVYPKDRTGRFDELKARRKDIVFLSVQWVENFLTPTEADNVMLTNTVRHADVGANVASTISLELCMFDRPVVNVAYDPPALDDLPLKYADYYKFDHYRAVVDSGAVQVASNPEEMSYLLMEALKHPEAQTTERKALLQSMFGETLDGKSSRRVADALLQIVAADTSLEG